jgi:hypothetical protein
VFTLIIRQNCTYRIFHAVSVWSLLLNSSVPHLLSLWAYQQGCMRSQVHQIVAGLSKLRPIQGGPGDNVSILGGIVSVILSKKKSVLCTFVLFRTVSEIELFHCTVPKLLIGKIFRIVSNTGNYFSSEQVGTVYLV